MSYETILYEKQGRVAQITLNRPEKLNAMNPTLLEELSEAVEVFDQDDESWIGILTGAGRSFCAGRDVQMFRDRLHGHEVQSTRRLGPPFLGDMKSGKPIIGAVHGHIFGLGLMLAGECDILLATENARFGMTEVRRSLSGGAVWARLSQWIPGKIASEMAITGEPISGIEAHRLGLVNKLVTEQQLLTSAISIAQRIIELPPLATRATVQAIRGASYHFIRERSSQAPSVQLNKTEDYKESINSFLEKRPPVYNAR